MKLKKKLLILLSAVCVLTATSALCACDTSGDFNVTIPPDSGNVVPTPDEGSTTKPDEGSTTKPDEGGTTKPDEGSTTEPDEGGTTKPDEGGTTKPDEGGTTKPDEGSTTKPDEGGTTKPDEGSTTKPDEGGTTKPDEGSTTTPTLKKFTGVTFADKTVTYNGNEQSVVVAGTLPQGTKITYTSNKATNVGTYNASAKLELEGYETLTLTAKLIINKATFTGVTFKDKTVTYNGSEQSVIVAGTLPQGTKVTYTSNTGTNAGTYNASVKLELEGYETLTLNAKLTINKATFTGITFANKTFVKTGGEKEITVSGDLPEGTQVSYTDNRATEEGEYTAKAVITNPNYETLTLTAKLKIKVITVVAKDMVNLLLDKPEPWSFLPEAFVPEEMAYAVQPVSDFTSFVSVSDIGDKIVGKQMAVLYEGLNDTASVLKNVDTVYAVAATIAEVYQTFINDNPDDYAQFMGEAAGFKLRITLDGEKSEMLVGNSAFSAELSYDKASGERTGRIQLTGGMAVKYEADENTLKLAVKATINGAGNLKQLVFARNNGAVAGHFYEYTGTESKGLKTSAAVISNSNTTIVMSDKRESEDLAINGYEEVYDSATGKYLGGRVQETIKVVDYDTMWFMLDDVSGFENVKVVNEKNGLNEDTVYVNNASTAFKTIKVNSLIPTSSRRFDVEMKDVFYVVAKTEEGKTKYETVKASIPMLFVQLVKVDEFGENVKDNNSAEFATAPVLPDYTAVTGNYDSLQELFLTLKQQVTYSEIMTYIGEKDEFFTTQTEN